MEQNILFCIIALALCQTIFLLNHRCLLRGTIFSAVTGIGCLAALTAVFPAAGISLTASGMAVSAVFGIPGCIFLLLIKLICRL